MWKIWSYSEKLQIWCCNSCNWRTDENQKLFFVKSFFFLGIYLFPSPVFIELKTVKLSINKLILHAKFARTLPSRVVWLRPCQDYIISWNMRKYEDGVQSFIKIRWKIWVLTSTYNIWGVRPPPPPLQGCQVVPQPRS